MMMTNSETMKEAMRNDPKLVGKEIAFMENPCAAIRTVRVEGVMTGTTEVRVRVKDENGKRWFFFMTRKVLRMLAHGRACDMNGGGCVWCPDCIE